MAGRINRRPGQRASRKKDQRLGRRCLQLAVIMGAAVLLARSVVQISSVHVATQASQTESSQWWIPTRATSSPSKPNEDTRPISSQRILLYVTTHISTVHEWYLRSCWPPALRNSRLLGAADVTVYLNAPPERRDEATKTLRETFAGKNLTIHVRDNLGYQPGAMSALSDATEGGWFEGYDWVIRANPDAILRDDAFLIDVMENDLNATGLLIDCNRNSIKTHTDFFVIKPGALHQGFRWRPTGNAETSFKQDIQTGILRTGGARWIEGAAPRPAGTCRAGMGRAMNETPVVHFHPTKEMMGGASCPIPFPNEGIGATGHPLLVVPHSFLAP